MSEVEVQERWIVNARNAEETQVLAQRLAALLEPGSILLLAGNLGSGKTTFVQGLGKGLGIQAAITSPTFTLIDEYTCGRLPLYHVDLYRLEPSQVKELYLQEYWRGVDFPLGIVAIEWSEKLEALPTGYLKIGLDIDPANDEGRQICLTATGEQYLEIVRKLSV